MDGSIIPICIICCCCIMYCACDIWTPLGSVMVAPGGRPGNAIICGANWLGALTGGGAGAPPGLLQQVRLLLPGRAGVAHTLLTPNEAAFAGELLGRGASGSGASSASAVAAGAGTAMHRACARAAQRPPRERSPSRLFSRRR